MEAVIRIFTVKLNKTIYLIEIHVLHVVPTGYKLKLVHTNDKCRESSSNKRGITQCSYKLWKT